MPQDDFDVAIVGGSFAGLTAALFLARARQRAVIYDHGETRNRFADAGHGFLGQDKRPPEAIRLAGRADVLAYPSVTLRSERVQRLARAGDLFRVEADQPVLARRVILAYGMRDVLPDLPGLAQGWGHWALQCPYCHGYENADRPTGFLMTADGLPPHLHLLRGFSADFVLFTNGFALSEPERTQLTLAGIAVHDTKVARFQTDANQLQAVVLQDGHTIPRAVIYLVSASQPSCDLADQLACALLDGPTGPYLSVDAMQQTSVAGVYAAGDLCRPIYGAVFAAADGARAGVACHHSLLVPLPPV